MRLPKSLFSTPPLVPSTISTTDNQSSSSDQCLKLTVRDPLPEDIRSSMSISSSSLDNTNTDDKLVEKTHVATIEGLNESETEALLTRLPEIIQQDSDQKEFVVRFVFYCCDHTIMCFVIVR